MLYHFNLFTFLKLIETNEKSTVILYTFTEVFAINTPDKICYEPINIFSVMLEEITTIMAELQQLIFLPWSGIPYTF
jgi:hypothetical protein